MLIALGLVACGGNAVPPGTTNSQYGSVGPSGQISRSDDINRRARTGEPRQRAAIPFKPVPASSLTGLSEAAFTQKVGTPEMIRGEGDIKVWQYRSSECSFDAFFAPGAETGSPRQLRHMLARMRRGNQPISIQDCLDQIVKQHQQRG
ncbi:hypothetical protein LPB41_05915 [Thalassospira sp. MA62]|nr:hypothetical protein [Thalassospira sp. MA62]